jgi:alanyl-tRNA synthetase
MTSAQIRQSFLDFFQEKNHTLVPSSSLRPDSPNLLFTNAGMNQFVPIFLGEQNPDVSKWASAIPRSDTRAADTQKCIRAGGKHNDLDDVGLDTYHHTFFEMLGNWSFGDYFKKEAIHWAWELVIERWKFPAERLYATIYQPDEAAGDPAERDEEAWGYWAEKFRAAGLDPDLHIINGDKKDNFWMMGDTGPCGPCSELHFDLTPAGDTRGALVNRGDGRCIEIWNLVFIQFNANPDGTFSALPSRHVDTGMGFERVASIIQGTKGFTDFANANISNYETDVFRPLFDEIEKLSGRPYGHTLPPPGSTGDTNEEKSDVAFRVIADHIRTLSFAIADGISPGNTDRNYVLRRILRRAVRYGRTLGFHEPFFFKLVDVLAREMGEVFPELRTKQKHIEEVLRREEEAFNRTLDRGIELFHKETDRLQGAHAPRISAEFAFQLYDTYGFPLDLTELMARERGLTVDTEGFETLMEAQRSRARASQKKQVIELSEVSTKEPTRFVGYDTLEVSARVLEVLVLKTRTAVVLDASACYAEMGGQVGDRAELSRGTDRWPVANTQKSSSTWLHILVSDEAPEVGDEVTLSVDAPRRRAIEGHHTVTHLLHRALHEVVSHEATQKGSFVGPEKLTFDFNGGPLTPDQIRAVESQVNTDIAENAPVSWSEVPHASIKDRPDIMQFFGDKYGETVRVVQIGGAAGQLDGYSMELCAGTHTRDTGSIGIFKIVSEGAIAAGVRRIEAVAGEALGNWARQEAVRQDGQFASLQRKKADLPSLTSLELEDAASAVKSVESRKSQLEKLEEEVRIFEKQNAKAAEGERKSQAVALAKELSEVHAPAGFCVSEIPEADGKLLQAIVEILRASFPGPVFLAGVSQGRVALIASVPKDLTQNLQAGKLIQTIAPLVGGKGGGRPDLAQGGGTDPGKLTEALTKAQELIQAAL